MKFIVEGKPQGKARPRVVRNRYTGRSVAYTPKDTGSYEDLIRWSYKAAGGENLGENVLQVDITAVYPIPKSYSKKKQNDALADRLRPTVKPDCDNIIKVVLDALNGIAYYDDKQVVSVSCNKYFGSRGYLGIKIEELKI